MRTQASGNSLIEYATPLAVFFLAGVIITVVTGLPERFQGLMAHTMNAGISGSTLEVQPLGNSAGIDVPVPTPALQTAALSGEEPGTAAGNLNYLDLGKAIETSGANGTTRMLMNSLISIADQLLDDGEISFEQAFALKKLANQGHTIAGIEAVLEQATDAYRGAPADFGTSMVIYNGRTYTIEDLGNRIGYQTGLKSGPFLNDPFNAPLTEPDINHLNQFKTLFREAVSSGALNNPETRSIVTYLAEDVLKLAGEVEVHLDRIHEGAIPPDSLRQAMISDLTHHDSRGICHTGKGKDSGKHCS